MDYRRIALFSSLAAVSMYLLIQWNGQQNPNVQAYANATQNPTVETTTSVVSEVAKNETETASNSTSVVDSSDLIKSKSPEVTYSSGESVSVNSDVLNVTIDIATGNITYAALTQYPIALETPDQFVTLLNDNDNYRFIAESVFFTRIRRTIAKHTVSKFSNQLPS